MLVCNRCGKVEEYNSQIISNREKLGVYLDYDTCPDCGGQMVEATQCSCGRWFDNSELCGICEVCLDEEQTVENAIQIGKQETVDVEVNGFLAQILTNEQIEEILSNWVKEKFADHCREVKDYLDSHLYDFSELVEKKFKGE